MEKLICPYDLQQGHKEKTQFLAKKRKKTQKIPIFLKQVMMYLIGIKVFLCGLVTYQM